MEISKYSAQELSVCNGINLMTSKASYTAQWMGNCPDLCTEEKLWFDIITITYTFMADEEDK